MAMRSHVDPCTFVAFIHIPGTELDEALIDALKGFRAEQGSRPDLLAMLPLRSHQIRFHEDYHFWQGLRLPFVYRYATIAVRQAFLAFRELATGSKDHRVWDCRLPEFERLSLDERIGRYPGHIVWGREDAKFPVLVEDEIRLRPLDLLECATSLAEFQVTAQGDKTDPLILHRWAKRNPAYLEPYEFASRFLEDRSLALRCCLPLINAAFHTSEPVRTFVELLGRIWGTFATGGTTAADFLAQREPCRWSELFAKWLDKIVYEAKPDADGRLLGSPYHRITLDEWVGGALVDDEGGFLIHPFLGPPAREWIERQKATPEYGMLMDQPAWVSNETFRKARTEFSPSMTVYRFHLDDGLDRTFITGTADGRSFSSVPLENAAEWRGFVADLLTQYGAVRRASGAHFDAEQRTCHHLRCPHYDDNFCNMYPIVPEDFESCGFPARIHRLIEITGR